MKKLLPRKHHGCDPMCERCCEWSERLQELVQPAAREAIKAFVNVIEARHPQLSGVDPMPHDLELFLEAADDFAWSLGIAALEKTGVRVGAKQQQPLFDQQRITDPMEAEDGPR